MKNDVERAGEELAGESPGEDARQDLDQAEQRRHQCPHGSAKECKRTCEVRGHRMLLRV